jgi:hypothetical protein
MSSQPLGGISVGVSAVRVVGDGVRVGLLAGRPAVAGGRAQPLGSRPLRPADRGPLGVLGPTPAGGGHAPTTTTVASIPSRTVPLAVRPTRPGRCRVLPATFAIAASPLVPSGSTATRLRRTEPSGRSGYSAGIRADVGHDKVTKPT